MGAFISPFKIPRFHAKALRLTHKVIRSIYPTFLLSKRDNLTLLFVPTVSQSIQSNFKDKI